MFPGKHSEGTVGSTERARYEPQRVNASDSHPIILQISEIESSEKKNKTGGLRTSALGMTTFSSSHNPPLPGEAWNA